MYVCQFRGKASGDQSATRRLIGALTATVIQTVANERANPSVSNDQATDVLQNVIAPVEASTGKKQEGRHIPCEPLYQALPKKHMR